MSLSQKTLLVFFLAAYAAAALIGLSAHQDPAEMDTTAYLSAASGIAKTGGILAHLPNCISGVYREATQHPLYLLLLSAVAKPDLSCFVQAKLLTLAVGFIVVPVFFFFLKRSFGIAAAWTGSALLVTNATFIQLTTMVACEGMLVLFCVLFWGAASRGFEDPKQWLLAGLWASLAFLTKSLGIFLTAVFVLSSFWICRRKLTACVKNRFFWGFFIVFFAVASPLLIRNARVFGTPFYSNSSSVLWIDEWADYFRPDLEQHRPTMSDYLKTHPPAKIAGIISQGLFERDPIMVVDGLKPFVFWKRPIDLNSMQGFLQPTVSWQGGWALFICIAALVGLIRERRRPLTVLAVISLAVFLFFVGWYSKVFPKTPPTRLLIPAIILILAYAACALAALADACAQAILRGRRSGRWPQAAAAVFLIFFLSSVSAGFDWRKIDLKRSYSLNPAAVLQLGWLMQTAAPSQTV
ncbi:MAG: glycosyltransferase family 39 protein, partial [Candidatus Omnitrophota bacterium]